MITMESIYSTHNNKQMSHILILPMKLMTCLWMMTKIRSINIMHHFIVKELWRCIFSIRIWLSKTKISLSEKHDFGFIIKETKDFWISGIIAIFVLSSKKLSLNMDQIIEHNNFSNHNIYSYNQIIKIMFNLVCKKGEKMTTPHPNSPVYIIHY